MKKRIHVFGASGAGTTTIAKIVSKQLGYKHFDSDNYFWLPTINPFTIERERNECLKMMDEDLSKNDEWVLSGSIANWGNILVPYFDLVIFVYVPPEIRLERLKKREYERYGNEIIEGGNRYKECQDFLSWASAYDDGTRNGRSLARHEKWLKNINCPTQRITNIDLAASVEAVMQTIVSE